MGSCCDKERDVELDNPEEEKFATNDAPSQDPRSTLQEEHEEKEDKSLREFFYDIARKWRHIGSPRTRVMVHHYEKLRNVRLVASVVIHRNRLQMLFHPWNNEVFYVPLQDDGTHLSIRRDRPFLDLAEFSRLQYNIGALVWHDGIQTRHLFLE